MKQSDKVKKEVEEIKSQIEGLTIARSTLFEKLKIANTYYDVRKIKADLYEINRLLKFAIRRLEKKNQLVMEFGGR